MHLWRNCAEAETSEPNQRQCRAEGEKEGQSKQVTQKKELEGRALFIKYVDRIRFSIVEHSTSHGMPKPEIDVILGAKAIRRASARGMSKGARSKHSGSGSPGADSERPHVAERTAG